MLTMTALGNAVIEWPAADAHDAWSGRGSLPWPSLLRLMLMMLGLAVDTGNAVIEWPAADAHDDCSGQCRDRVACG